MVLGRSSMEVPLFVESAKPSLTLSAPASHDHSCRSRLLSSQKRRVRFAGYSLPDRPARPPHPPVCPPPACRFCPPSRANPRPPKFLLSTRRSPSCPSPPSGKILPCSVRAHTQRHRFPYRS